MGDRRYIVCRNLVEAAQTARTREAVVATLRAKLRHGDKALVGNSAYRRYLKTPDQQHFTLDEDRVADDARYDGLYVLRTNTQLHPLKAMLRYRDLLIVEQVFRTEKTLLATRPIYHQTDEAIRGHVFCSFLALVLRKDLEERLATARLKPEWRELLTDLDRLPGNRRRARRQALRPANAGDWYRRKGLPSRRRGTAAEHPRRRSRTRGLIGAPSPRGCSAKDLNRRKRSKTAGSGPTLVDRGSGRGPVGAAVARARICRACFRDNPRRRCPIWRRSWPVRGRHRGSRARHRYEFHH